MQSHITATHSKGFPAEVANHLANTAGVMPAVADIPCSTSLHHLHFFIRYYQMYVGSKPWRHIPGEVGLKIDMLGS